MKAHRILDDFGTPDRPTLAWVHPASAKAVRKVLRQSTATGHGRSDWVWLRLPNGDLIMGVFPQGDTYLEMEADAQYPGD